MCVRAHVQVRAKHGAWEGFDVREMREHFVDLPNHHKEDKRKAE